MSRRPASVADRLDALYAELPRIECRGSCHDSCSVIEMTRSERRRIESTTGVVVTPAAATANSGVCPALTVWKQCSVYPLRPMICRLWGLTRALTCSYGCVPEGGYLTEAQVYEFLARAADIAGEPAQAARFRRVAALPNLERAMRQVRGGPMQDIAEAEQDWNRQAPPPRGYRTRR